MIPDLTPLVPVFAFFFFAFIGLLVALMATWIGASGDMVLWILAGFGALGVYAGHWMARN